jgi:MSHA biogenesis protein MshQ
MPAGCSGSNGTYTCSSLALGYLDTWTIGSPKPATITINGDLDTSSTVINGGGSASDLNLIVTGTLTMPYQTTIVANIQAGSVNDVYGYHAITGSIKTTTGSLWLYYATVVNGPVSSTSGAITAPPFGSVTGNITNTSGDITIGYAGHVTGNVTTAGVISLVQDSVVNGNVTGTTGAVNVGYNARVNGRVRASSGAISLDMLSQVSTCVESTSAASITLGYQASAAAVCCGPSCSTSCVVNNSSYAMPATCTPTISVHHYQLALPTASLACVPSTVTVTACADSSSPCTNAATTVSGQTASLATSAGTLGATSVSFNASGVATTTLSHPAATDGSSVSVTLSNEQTAASTARQCCPNGASCSTANSCSTTFNTAGFIVSTSAGGSAATVPAQTAGTGSGTYYLRAVKTGTTTQACEAALTGSATVNWALQCQNPTTCSSGNLMTLTGSSASTIASNPASGITSTTAVPMTFDANGNASFSFSYADVGQVTLTASKTGNSTTLSGSTNAFVVKPASFSLSNIRQTASPNTANPAAASAAGGVFVKAGESFSATVTALTSGGAATPNFGKETAPEGVLLTPTLVLPAGGTSGSLSNATLAGSSFSNGAATATQLAYSEVGVITLTPSIADGSYLGAGNVSGSSTGNVGRFVPARFALSGTSITQRSGLSCSPASTFSYLGETFRIGLTLTAQNTNGATTTNYTGSYAKFDPTQPSAWQLAGRDGSTVFTTGNSRLSLGSATGSWSAGVTSGATLTASALRASSPDGPFSAAFGVAPIDSDGVALASFDMVSTQGGSNDRATVGTVPLRFGRLRLSNAMGAADRTLALPATLQYWNGSTWATNTQDSCTSVSAPAVSFGNLRRTLTTSDTAVTGALTFSAGVGALRLAAPASGHSGTLDVALSLGTSATDTSCLQPWTPDTGDAASAGANLAHLRGAWCGSTWGQDPSARASFGLQRTQDHTIYRRENY